MEVLCLWLEDMIQTAGQKKRSSHTRRSEVNHKKNERLLNSHWSTQHIIQTQTQRHANRSGWIPLSDTLRLERAESKDSHSAANDTSTALKCVLDRRVSAELPPIGCDH